jgi:acyl-CoA thioester hydrolase
MIQPFKIQVRFSDLDVLGHVNNTIHLSYFEMARIHYFKELLGQNWDWHSFGMVLVKNEVEYLKSILLFDEPEVIIFTEHIGTKSFTIGYEIFVRNEIYIKGRSVQVSYDAKTQKTIEIPQTMRSALEQLIREQSTI